MPQGLRDALAKIEVIGGGLTVGKEMKLDLAVSVKDEQSARSVRDALDKGVKLGLIGLALLGDDRKELSTCCWR